MSLSPPLRRLSTANSHNKQEELINAYEAEEERIINVLSRKLEQVHFFLLLFPRSLMEAPFQLREEKIDLENALEAESESHVNRLSRELSVLRLAQHQQLQQNGATSVSASPGNNVSSSYVPDPTTPSAEVMLDALRRENEQLINRLVDTERDYIRIARVNEIYREELIELRRRVSFGFSYFEWASDMLKFWGLICKLGLSLDNLIGLSPPDPYSQPTHRRSMSSGSSSPSSSILLGPTHSHPTRPTNGMPIPRPSSQIHRPVYSGPSENTTPLSHSPSSSDSPFPFSPVISPNPASYVSNATNVTTPPSSASLNSNPPAPYPSSARTLSYPSVPPPSLSSSFGSPTVPYHVLHRDPSTSPIEGLSRRSSTSNRRSSLSYGNGGDRAAGGGHGIRAGAGSSSHSSRRASVERGARVAETGQLIPRSRAGSQSVTLAATEEAPALDEE
jgi:hypothetical protein